MRPGCGIGLGTLCFCVSPSWGAEHRITAHTCLGPAEVLAWADVRQASSAVECSVQGLNFERVEGWKEEAGGGQGAHPCCLSHGKWMLYAADGRAGMQTPLSPCFCFWGQATGHLNVNRTEIEKYAMHTFQRREQRLLFLWQGNEPSRGSCNKSSPYHDGVPWRKSPKPLHLLQTLLPLPQPFSLSQSAGAHPCLLVTLTLASGLEKSWGKELQLGTETTAFKPLKKICKKVCLGVHYV